MSIIKRARVAAPLISLSLLSSFAHAQAADTVGASAGAQVLPAQAAPAPETRPVALIPLYASFVGLQALDFNSTRRAIASGAGMEANPAVQVMVGSPAALFALKAGTTASIIFACERLRKDHHPLAAVMLMVGVNSAYAVVTAHNYAVLHHLH